MEKEQVYLWIGAVVIYFGIFVYFCNKNCAGNQGKIEENNADTEMQALQDDPSRGECKQADDYDTTTETRTETTNDFSYLNPFTCFGYCGTNNTPTTAFYDCNPS